MGNNDIPTPREPNYHLYILLCDENIFYTGIAIDPQLRLSQHQSGAPYGAKFTRRFKNLQLVYQVPIGTRSEAQSLEIKVKKLSKRKKAEIINKQCTLDELEIFISNHA